MSELVKHVYGRAITFRYSPAADAESFQAYSLVSARLYDAYPSDAQRAAADGSELEEVTTWTLANVEATGAAEFLVTFADLTDPSPTDQRDYDKYYVALNYRAENGGAVIQDVEQIFVYRPRGYTGKIRVSAADVYALDDAIEDRAPSREWVELKCDAAIEYLVAIVQARGYDKKNVFNWEELNPCARRLAAYYCCFAFASDGSEFWLEKAERWKSESTLLLDVAKLGYDTTGQGTPEPTDVVQTGGAVAFSR